MVEQNLNKDYWSGRYQSAETGWDIGYPSTPLKTYIDTLADKNLRILVPGAGNAYEVEYLWQNGFRNVFLLDIAPEPIARFRDRVTDFPENQGICEDFFLHRATYDLILEQTFFCALHPSFRQRYAEQMAALLPAGGILAGLLFDAPMNADQPPYGGTMEEYRNYFAPWFEFRVFAPCENSIAPRAGKEMFMVLERK